MNLINDEPCLRAIITLAIVLGVIFGSIIITCFAMFFDYNAKLKKDGIEIVKLKKFKKEIEKKNGKEQHEIDKLNQKIENLEKLNNLLVEKVLNKSEIKK